MSKTNHDPAVQTTPSFRVSRRNFLKAAGAGTAVAGAATFGSIPFSQSRAAAQGEWDQEADIVVVGSGAAALTAAATSISLGDSVVVLEKAANVGGTTIKSGGVYWVPNNSLMREFGIEDPKEDAIRYMARLAFPEQYDAEDPQFGLSDHKYSLIEGFYDNGPVAIDALAESGALVSGLYMETEDEPFPDYYAELEENLAPRGRGLWAVDEEGNPGPGTELIRQLQQYVEANGVEIQLEHRVTAAVTNDSGEVIGVEVVEGSSSSDDGTPEAGNVKTVRAKKGVIFGSGGFTHNDDLVANYLRGPIAGGCAVPTNEGDFVTIAGALGAPLGNMKNAFLAEVVLEQAVNFASVPNDVFVIPGHSMIVVNPKGERIYNEKKTYNERTHLHWIWDPATASYPNYVTIMVFDQHAVDTNRGVYPIPAEGVEVPYLITGDTLEELSANIDERLAGLVAHTGGARLSEDFNSTLAATIERFNGFAEAGVDEDFHRGETPIEGAFERSFSGIEPDENGVIPTMHPISDEGPYYAVLIGPGTLDTNGGPVVNANSQVLDTKGNPIPGLYGAGNAIESAAGQSYWAAGGTLGGVITTGYMAAVTANKEPEKTQ